MNEVKNYFYSKTSNEIVLNNIDNSILLKNAENYLENALADADFALATLKPYLNKEIEILEIGGGLHILSSYLQEQGYKITTIEPGDFTSYIIQLRKNIIEVLKPTNLFNNYLENYNTDKKFDLIFSINVLEHVESVENHLNTQINLLLDENSICLIRCPNYNIPYEPHFFKFFVPLFPQFTFKHIHKKELINLYGFEKYNDILKNLNFNCKYSNIKKLFKIKIHNPFVEIFNRISEDEVFRTRMFKNKLIKILYKFLYKSNLKILFKFIPKRYYPYLIFEIPKD
jgi:2-polyprenyl-3-methyl-5-hydroxy-6-metoxy-1,4-benzoquinol methylase